MAFGFNDFWQDDYDGAPQLQRDPPKPFLRYLSFSDDEDADWGEEGGPERGYLTFYMLREPLREANKAGQAETLVLDEADRVMALIGEKGMSLDDVDAFHADDVTFPVAWRERPGEVYLEFDLRWTKEPGREAAGQ